MIALIEIGMIIYKQDCLPNKIIISQVNAYDAFPTILITNQLYNSAREINIRDI